MSLHPDRDQAARLLSTRRCRPHSQGPALSLTSHARYRLVEEWYYQLHVDTSSTPRATLDIYTGRLQYSLVDSSKLCGSGFGFVLVVVCSLINV